MTTETKNVAISVALPLEVASSDSHSRL